MSSGKIAPTTIEADPARSDAYEQYTRTNNTVISSLAQRMTQGARSSVKPAPSTSTLEAD
ncbi:hypothetical protein L914_17752 [Phytophthora nicotianae]|uniref:Uncharacterized protein n=1 Tax=Phytophthora nicotianae TaxID=4792 RepID=W2MIM5_PHYNI|nr:hypothetical protein L914_17752 [Phytophthora nicotianae]